MIVEWLTRTKGVNGKTTEQRERGTVIGPVSTAKGTLLVVKCDDGRVREIPISSVVP